MLPVYKEYNNLTVSLTIIVYIFKTKLIRICKFLKLCHHFFFLGNYVKMSLCNVVKPAAGEETILAVLRLDLSSSRL